MLPYWALTVRKGHAAPLQRAHTKIFCTKCSQAVHKNIPPEDVYKRQAYNRAGVDVTPVDGILTTDNDEIVWTVEKTEGGFFLKRADGAKLSIGNKPEGGTRCV